MEVRFKASGTRRAEANRTSFVAWSAAQGITTNGIDYQKIPNRGFGIVAQRRLKVITTLSTQFLSRIDV